GEVDRPEGHHGLPEVGGDRSIPRQGLRRPDLAERRRHAGPEEVRDVPPGAVRLIPVRGDEEPGRPRRPRLLPVPDARHAVRRRGRPRRADRHLGDRGEVAEPLVRDRHGYPAPMLGETEPLDAAPLEPQTGGAAAIPRRGRSRYSILTRRDKTVMALMVGVPTFLCVTLIWLPTIASIGLSFTNWRGITPLTDQNLVGLKNYVTLFTTYPFFWPAVIHNVLWLLVFVFIA